MEAVAAKPEIQWEDEEVTEAAVVAVRPVFEKGAAKYGMYGYKERISEAGVLEDVRHAVHHLLAVHHNQSRSWHAVPTVRKSGLPGQYQNCLCEAYPLLMCVVSHRIVTFL